MTMNKKQLTLKILLPILVAAIVTLIVLEIKCLDFHGDDENGLLFAIALLLNIIPMIALIVLGIAAAVIFILLFTVNNKKPVMLSSSIILCLMLPFSIFSVFVDITALSIYVEVPVVAVFVLAVDVVALILSLMEFRRLKGEADNKNER